MKTLNILLAAILSLFFSSIALSFELGNGVNSKWTKVIELSSQQDGDQTFTNYLPNSSTKLQIFVHSNIKKKKVYALKSEVSHYSGTTTSLSEPIELDITRNQYLKLLDIATRQPDSWANTIVYDVKENCDGRRVMKHLYFNGNEQSILPACGEVLNLPILSEAIAELVERLEAIMIYEQH